MDAGYRCLPQKKAFGQVKAGFDKLCEQRTAAISQASKALNYSFTFMEDAFGEGQEMVIFVTELTMDSEISAFITENGCEKYFSIIRLFWSAVAGPPS